MRDPKSISWAAMQEYMDSAQALVNAWAMQDDDAIREICETFIEPHIDAGDTDLIIYAIASVCILNVRTLCNHFNEDLMKMLAMCNEGRVNRKKRDD